MNLFQEDQGSGAWLVWSREFDKVIIIASYGESMFRDETGSVFIQVTNTYTICCCLLANQSDVFLGNVVLFDNILSTVKWELLCEMLS